MDSIALGGTVILMAGEAVILMGLGVGWRWIQPPRGHCYTNGRGGCYTNGVGGELSPLPFHFGKVIFSGSK